MYWVYYELNGICPSVSVASELKNVAFVVADGGGQMVMMYKCLVL